MSSSLESNVECCKGASHIEISPSCQPSNRHLGHVCLYFVNVAFCGLLSKNASVYGAMEQPKWFLVCAGHIMVKNLFHVRSAVVVTTHETGKAICSGMLWWRSDSHYTVISAKLLIYPSMPADSQKQTLCPLFRSTRCGRTLFSSFCQNVEESWFHKIQHLCSGHQDTRSRCSRCLFQHSRDELFLRIWQESSRS